MDPDDVENEKWGRIFQYLCFRRCDQLNRYIVTALGLSLLRNRGFAAKDMLRMTNDE